VILLTISDGKIVRDERIYDLTAVMQCLEKAQLDKELSMAAEVQRALWSRTDRGNAFCEAAGDSLPWRSIGGDFFDMGALPSECCGIMFGDTSGKGPAAAILAAMIQGMLAVEVESGSSPSSVLSRVNSRLSRRGIDPRFATLVFGKLSPEGRFVYSNAGHNPPILLAGDRVRRLETGGPILGAFEGSTFEQETIALNEGDTIIFSPTASPKHSVLSTRNSAMTGSSYDSTTCFSYPASVLFMTWQ
jgi:sigma-B regulation protein RsbU (phosphoserine phosphatase)